MLIKWSTLLILAQNSCLAVRVILGRGLALITTSLHRSSNEAFIHNIEQFVAGEGVDLITFEKGQRKDDISQRYLRKFKKDQGVLYVGKAQEKARIMRTERRRDKRTGATYPWIVQTTAMVNHYYFYCVDEDFGPFFLKFLLVLPLQRQALHQ